MTYIAEVSEDQASPELRRSYAEIQNEFGFLPHFWQAQGSRPDVVRAALDLWRLIYRTGVLPAALKEEIGLVVAATTFNSYCIMIHIDLLSRLGVDKALGRQLTIGYEAAAVPDREKALFRFADKLTRQPSSIRQEDVEELRRHGWDDASILEASLVASHFNFVTRLVFALGLVPEEVL